MTDSVADSKAEVKQATKYVKETENVAEKYSALTVSKNSSDVNMNVGEMPSAAFTAVPTLKSVKKVRNVTPTISHCHWAKRLCVLSAGTWINLSWYALYCGEIQGKAICCSVMLYHVFIGQHLHFQPEVDVQRGRCSFNACM